MKAWYKQKRDGCSTRSNGNTWVHVLVRRWRSCRRQLCLRIRFNAATHHVSDLVSYMSMFIRRQCSLSIHSPYKLAWVWKASFYDKKKIHVLCIYHSSVFLWPFKGSLRLNSAGREIDTHGSCWAEPKDVTLIDLFTSVSDSNFDLCLPRSSMRVA